MLQGLYTHGFCALLLTFSAAETNVSPTLSTTTSNSHGQNEIYSVFVTCGEIFGSNFQALNTSIMNFLTDSFCSGLEEYVNCVRVGLTNPTTPIDYVIQGLVDKNALLSTFRNACALMSTLIENSECILIQISMVSNSCTSQLMNEISQMYEGIIPSSLCGSYVSSINCLADAFSVCGSNVSNLYRSTYLNLLTEDCRNGRQPEIAISKHIFSSFNRVMDFESSMAGQCYANFTMAITAEVGKYNFTADISMADAIVKSVKISCSKLPELFDCFETHMYGIAATDFDVTLYTLIDMRSFKRSGETFCSKSQVYIEAQPCLSNLSGEGILKCSLSVTHIDLQIDMMIEKAKTGHDVMDVVAEIRRNILDITTCSISVMKASACPPSYLMLLQNVTDEVLPQRSSMSPALDKCVQPLIGNIAVRRNYAHVNDNTDLADFVLQEFEHFCNRSDMVTHCFASEIINSQHPLDKTLESVFRLDNESLSGLISDLCKLTPDFKKNVECVVNNLQGPDLKGKMCVDAWTASFLAKNNQGHSVDLSDNHCRSWKKLVSCMAPSITKCSESLGQALWRIGHEALREICFYTSAAHNFSPRDIMPLMTIVILQKFLTL